MLKVSFSTAVLSFDPTEMLGYQQFIFFNLFVDTLVRLNEQGTIEAGLAEKWNFSGDGRVASIHISPTARFHDGSPVSSSDVAWSLSRHFSADSKSVVKSLLATALETTEIDPKTGTLKAIEIHDQQKFSIRLKGYYPPFLRILASPAFGVLPKNFSAEKPIGSGPYRFKARSSQGQVTLIKSADYFGTPATFDEVTASILKFKTEIFSAFSKREIDIAIGVPFSEIIDSEIPKGSELQHTNSLSITSVFQNQSNPHLRDKTTRQEIAGVLNWLKAKPNLLSKFDHPQSSFLPHGIMLSTYYDRSPRAISPDSVRSQWKLKGLTQLRVVIPMGFYTHEFKKELVSSFLQSGVAINLEELKGFTLGDAITKGQYDLMFLPYAGSFPDPDGFHDLLNPTGLMKAAGLPTKELVANLSKARFSLDNQHRLREFEKHLRPFEEEAYIVPIAQQNLPILFRKGWIMPDTTYRFHTDLRQVRIVSDR